MLLILSSPLGAEEDFKKLSFSTKSEVAPQRSFCLRHNFACGKSDKVEEYSLMSSFSGDVINSLSLRERCVLASAKQAGLTEQARLRVCFANIAVLRSKMVDE